MNYPIADEELSLWFDGKIKRKGTNYWLTVWGAVTHLPELENAYYVEGVCVFYPPIKVIEHAWIELDGKIIEALYPTQTEFFLAFFPVLKFNRQKALNLAVKGTKKYWLEKVLPAMHHQFKNDPNYEVAHTQALEACNLLAATGRYDSIYRFGEALDGGLALMQSLKPLAMWLSENGLEAELNDEQLVQLQIADMCYQSKLFNDAELQQTAGLTKEDAALLVASIIKN